MIGYTCVGRVFSDKDVKYSWCDVFGGLSPVSVVVNKEDETNPKAYKTIFE